MWELAVKVDKKEMRFVTAARRKGVNRRALADGIGLVVLLRWVKVKVL